MTDNFKDRTIKARDKAFSLEPTTIWKVRHKKVYADAHNHIYLGEVISKNPVYVMMRCVTFHFGKNVGGVNDIITGIHRIRRIPWSQIEVVHDLAKDFVYYQGVLIVDEEGTVVLRDNRYDCIVTKRTDRNK